MCIESPEFVECLRRALGNEGSEGRRFTIPGDEVEVEFKASRIRWREHTLSFTPLGSQAQSLIVAGGVENLIRRESEVV